MEPALWALRLASWVTSRGLETSGRRAYGAEVANAPFRAYGRLERIGVPLLLLFVGGGVAALWPWLQVRSRGKRFEQIIKRELAEIGPNPEDPIQGKDWWEHVTKRFVHEEIFKHENISQNRDFLLTLDGSVVYEVTQLWTALEKRDATQWMRCIGAVSRNKRLTSKDSRTSPRRRVAGAGAPIRLPQPASSGPLWVE